MSPLVQEIVDSQAADRAMVKATLKKFHVSYDRLGQEIGCSGPTLMRWVRGDTAYMKPATMQALARIMKELRRAVGE